MSNAPTNAPADAQTDAPIALDLQLFATISAELAEATRPVDEVLACFDLDEAAWSAMSQRFGEAMARDAGSAVNAGAVAIAFSVAFAAHQDRLAALPVLTVEQWAALQADVDAYDAPVVALAAHRLSLADYFRLVRHWATLLASDSDLAARHDAARASIELTNDEDEADEEAAEAAAMADTTGAHRR
jgi:hypothetical protein